MVFSSRNRLKLLARRLLGLLVLGAVLFASMPLPVAWKPVQKGGERFPCQNNSCGCSTPQQCWTRCCCYSPSQRRRWAEQHGVTPPEYAVLDEDEVVDEGHAASEVLSASRVGDERPASCCASKARAETSSTSTPAPEATAQALPRRCCQTQAKSGCCSGNHLAETETCSDKDRPEDREADGSDSTADSETVTVLSMMALKCQGASSDFTVLPWAIIESLQVSCTFPEPVVQPYGLEDHCVASAILAPETPPPRRASVLVSC